MSWQTRTRSTRAGVRAFYFTLIVVALMVAFAIAAAAAPPCDGATTPPVAVYRGNDFVVCPVGEVDGLEARATYPEAGQPLLVTERLHLDRVGAVLVWLPGEYPRDGSGNPILPDLNLTNATPVFGEFVEACGTGSAGATAYNAAGGSTEAAVLTATFRACEPVTLPGTRP